MTRLLLNLLTALSLLLCVAMVGLCVRSHWRSDLVGWVWPERVGHGGSAGPFPIRGRMVYAADVVTIESTAGVLYATYTTKEPHERLGAFFVGGPPYRPTGAPGWCTFATELHPIGPFRQRAVLFPHWTVAAAAAMLPALWVVRLRRTRRTDRPGRCPRCGYDLRATPNRCPECGCSPSVSTTV